MPRRLYDQVFTADARKTALVVIWGHHSPDWLAALAPEAAVWRGMATVGAVILRSIESESASVPAASGNENTHAPVARLMHQPAGARVPWCARFGRRVVVIPLMEPHILGRPRTFVSLVGSDNAVGVLSDKARFAEYCALQGLAHVVPASYPNFGDARFPCVLKRTDLNNSQGVEIVESAEQGNRLLETPLFAGHEAVIQEHVRFLTDYTIHCVCVGGRILWHVAYAFILDSYRIRMGDVGELRRAVMPAYVSAILESILVPLNYSGPCNVDCTWDAGDASGRFTVFEINPRLGGSLMRPQNVVDLSACLSAIVTEALKLPPAGEPVVPVAVVPVTAGERGLDVRYADSIS